MSGPFTEDPTPPEANPEWLARYEAKMADLMAAREVRARTPSEGPEAWARVEALVDLVHLERVERMAERKRREQD